MNLTINGELKSIEAKQGTLSLSNLIKQLEHHPLLIVVELNETILPPGNWDQQQIHDGDSLEIVTIVGGGS